jgi:hypothetical protein
MVFEILAKTLQLRVSSQECNVKIANESIENAA